MSESAPHRRWLPAIASLAALAVVVAAVLVMGQLTASASKPSTGSSSSSPAASSGTTWMAPGTLLVPPGAIGSTGLTLAWTAPQESWPVSGYRITCDGHDLGESGQDHSAAQSAITAFRTDPTNAAAHATSTHYFSVTGLQPSSTHSFTVAALDSQSQPHPFGNTLTVTTTPASPVTDVVSAGAVGDGEHDDTRAVQQAIDAAPAGGTVLLPAGRTFLIGPIQLRSELTLDVEGTVLGSTLARDYVGTTKDQPLALISAGSDKTAVKNLRIVGDGTIDGQGWKTVTQGAPAAQQFAKGDASSVASTGLLAASQDSYAQNDLDEKSEKAYQWRSSLISVRDASGLFVGGGLSLVNPSMHVLTVNDSHDVTLDGLDIDSYDTNNGDGIDFSNSTGLDVLDSVFNTGDDSVNLNAGYGLAGEKQPPVSQVWVFDNYFRHGHAAVALGSGTAAGISQVIAEDNVVDGSASGLRLKSSAGNGGGAHDVIFRNSALKDITEEQGEPFVVTTAYPESHNSSGGKAPDGPLFHDVTVSNCTIDTTSGPGIAITGSASATPYRIDFSGLQFTRAKAAQISQLHNSSFTDVTSDLGSGFFAQLTNDSGLVFTGTAQ